MFRLENFNYSLESTAFKFLKLGSETPFKMQDAGNQKQEKIIILFHASCFMSLVS